VSEPAPRRRLDLRLAEALKDEFVELRLSGPTAGVAFRAALASVLSMIVAMALHFDRPYWAAITAVSIVMPDVSSSFVRSVDRCLGTVTGAAVGYFGARLVDEPLMFQLICASAVSFGIYGSEAQRPRIRRPPGRGDGGARHVRCARGAGGGTQARRLPFDGDHGRGRGFLSRADCARAARPTGARRR
jgi:hypothetical protein